jgi:hypothetical protein
MIAAEPRWVNLLFRIAAAPTRLSHKMTAAMRRPQRRLERPSRPTEGSNG